MRNKWLYAGHCFIKFYTHCCRGTLVHCMYIIENNISFDCNKIKRYKLL